MTAAAARFALAVCLPAAAAGQQAIPLPRPVPIQDTSFLIEEAYNQEPGSVQHITTVVGEGGGSWSYSLTQEWPVSGQRHQVSFTVPVEHGMGAVAINYRRQLAGIGGGTAFAPRFSVLLPTAGAGGTAVQVNLPVSAFIARDVVTHWNAGAALERRSATVYSAGASVIWLVRPSVNLMLELAWTGAAGSGDVVVNPGLRWAHNLGALQIVPGIAFPDGRDVFLYLSFEHPFRSFEPAPAP